ncbi:hypothetical protein V5799_003745 [Amblyomma americanum]|uniref:SAP domain-containing protein n=1 Tax=Amblyomma americanum TaxID=6943 RepID=A0AAQ4D830_AMBAM
MAQSTGSQSNAISEDATAARRTPSTDSTIGYSPLSSVYRNLLGTLTKKQLVDELKCCELMGSGGKDELISRILEDNIPQRASYEMDPPTISQAANEDDRQAYLEALSTIKELRSEVKDRPSAARSGYYVHRTRSVRQRLPSCPNANGKRHEFRTKPHFSYC